MFGTISDQRTAQPPSSTGARSPVPPTDQPAYSPAPGTRPASLSDPGTRPASHHPESPESTVACTTCVASEMAIGNPGAWLAVEDPLFRDARPPHLPSRSPIAEVHS